MEFAINPVDTLPVSGGVINDSFSDFMNKINVPEENREYLSSIYDIIENNGNNSDVVPGGRGSIKTANEMLNDVSRGESSNLESSKDYLERITGIIANGIYTAKEQNALNLADAEKTRLFNASEAEKSRAYQLMLRDTQIQSTMKQLKDAGINPLLALSGSLGYANASSPAQASSSHTSFGNDNSIMSALIIAVASAIGSITKILGLNL